MARRSSSTMQEELYSTPDDPARDDLDDARLLDLDEERESPFLRAQKRVPARRSPLPKKTATRLLWAVLALVVAALGGLGAISLYHSGEHYWRFSLQSSDDIELAGLSNVTRGQVLEVMGGDIGRNVFFVPLDERQKQLEQIPWIESASVMRFAPNRLRIQIQERTPVAFARVGSKVMLTDAGGTLMDLSSQQEIFVSGDRRHESWRTTLHTLRKDENLQPPRRRPRFRRRQLFEEPERSGPQRSRRREGPYQRSRRAKSWSTSVRRITSTSSRFTWRTFRNGGSSIRRWSRWTCAIGNRRARSW